MTSPLLEVCNLRVNFLMHEGLVEVVRGMSFEVARGETLVILGESGSGKTVSAFAVMGLLECPPAEVAAGEIYFQGQNLLAMTAFERRKILGEGIAMVFQDSLSALNPVFTVGFQIAEIFRVRRKMSRRQARLKAIELLRRVEIPQPERRVDDYPFQFSGGMRQRVMIAIAIALDPVVLIADEPTTALDVTVQAQIMDLLKRLQLETGMGLVLVTHDMGLAAEVADRVAIVYSGRVVEEGRVGDIYSQPRHPYTLGLLQSLPRADRDLMSLLAIEGSPPLPSAIPTGCEFSPRCGFVQTRCTVEQPPILASNNSRKAACFNTEEVLKAQKWIS